MTLKVFVGYDSRDVTTFQVCVRSLKVHASVPVEVVALDAEQLAAQGFYWRHQWLSSGTGEYHDAMDGRMSTAFTYLRYLVPALMNHDGLALYCDADFLWRDDVAKLFAQASPRRALQVVQHSAADYPARKMRDQPQPDGAGVRKNWASLILWNAKHPANQILDPALVNNVRRQYLHALSWLAPQYIGTLPLRWNWLAGISPAMTDPAAVHYTLGSPGLMNDDTLPFADEWRSYLPAHDEAA